MDKMASQARQVKAPRVTFGLVLRQLRRHDFAVLATASENGSPHAAGVNYGVSRPGRSLALYVMTRTHLQKARNIARNPNVSLVVPLTRRFLWFLPPPTIQLHGRAEILDWTDEEGTAVFERFCMGRRILAAYRASHRRGETRICFLKITPDPAISTYMVGSSIWALRSHMESGAGKVVIPAEYRSAGVPASPRRGLDREVGSEARVAHLLWEPRHAKIVSAKGGGDNVMTIRSRSYWKTHYVLETDADEIERHIKQTNFVSGAKRFELLTFESGRSAPSILISQGSGGHAYVFAELGYLMHLQGYNVFIMPKHGDGFTINTLVQRHQDAASQICSTFNDRLGIFGEGLGSFVSFYVALAHGPVKSLVCQNGPAILTEEAFQEAIMQGRGAGARRKRFLPLLRLAARPFPWIRLPISLYLDWQELIDPKEGNREMETRLVVGGYLKDPDFDRWDRLSSFLSQLTTPPPNPLTALTIPTMFLLPIRGWSDPSYIRGLYHRLPPIKKRLIEVDGSVYWMLSHPREASRAICEWFAETL